MNMLQKYWALLIVPGLILAACAGEVYLQRSPERPAVAMVPPVTSSNDLAAMDLDEAGDYSFVEKDLYIGGRVPTPPPGTYAVLCLCEEADPYRAKVADWRYEGIPDGPPAPPVEWLRDQVHFIAKQRKAGHQVYVHCWAGVSRAALVTTAYLMWEHHWTRDKALEFLQEQRPVISPNMYFMDLLSDWEDALKTSPATHAAGSEVNQ